MGDVVPPQNNQQAEQPETPAPPVDPPAAVRITRLDITISVPDLRNGDIATITQAAPRASIDRAYKWALIDHMPAESAMDCVDAVIRAQYAQMMVAAENAAAMTDAQRAQVRNNAIILGAVRASAMATYRLAQPDFNATECVGAGVRYVAQNGHHAIAASPGAATADARQALMRQMQDLSPLEVKVVGALMYLGMAVPVLQGVSLVATGHHYLPTTLNIFKGIKKQMIQVGKDEVRIWVEGLGEVFDDMAFHKSCHPISPPQKRRWAKQPDIAARLVVTGHGAAAIRLPAIPPDAQAGKASVAVAMKARATVAGMGHTMVITDGPALVTAVERAEEGRAELDAVQNLLSWVQTNAANISFCAGIVQATTEGAGMPRDSTLNAYNIKKLMADHATDVQRGATYSRAYATRLRESMVSGTFSDPAIHM
jgi:hypothetical protein